MKKKPVEYKGIWYDSISAVAHAHGVSPNTVFRRLRVGWSLEDALEVPISATRVYSDNSVTYRGKTYPSRRALCKELGVSVAMVQDRIGRGWSLEEAVEVPKLKGRKYMGDSVTYGGKTYSFRSDLCKELGVSANLVSGRMARGWSLEDALDQSKDAGMKRFAVTVDGVCYSSKKAVCEAYGVSTTTVRRRMAAGLSFEEALTSGCVLSKRKVEYMGVVYSCRSDLARAMGLSPGLVSNRLKDGWTLEDAVSAPKQGTIYEYGGKAFTSVAAVAKHIGVSSRTLWDRLRAGSTFEEACAWAEVRRDQGASKKGLSLRIRHLEDVESHRFVCNDTFVMLHCAKCGRDVLLSVEDALSFHHSDLCEENEWLRCPKVSVVARRKQKN